MSTRREFIKQSLFLSASLPFVSLSTFFGGRTEAVTVLVTEGGKGIQGVVVSDGFISVVTDIAGKCTLTPHRSSEFIQVSVPSGYVIPVTEHGTAEYATEIRRGVDGKAEVVFQLTPSGDDTRHQFLVLADPQTKDDYDMGRFHNETVPDIQQTIARYGGNTFGISCGDILYDDLTYFPQYEAAVKKLGVPFFQVLGNHDCDVKALSDKPSSATFKKHFGPSYYSFNRGMVHYIVIDNVLWINKGYIGSVTDEQLDWIKGDMEYVSKDKRIVVFMHIPAFSFMYQRLGKSKPENSLVQTNREAMYQLFAGYKTTFICGHIHECEFLEESGIDIHCQGAVCGAWWEGPICYDGTPNGYAVYEVNGTELQWRYKGTGLSEDEVFRVYLPGESSEHPESVVVNCWQADQEWKVTMIEGAKRTQMQQFTGIDPLSIQHYGGPEVPKRHKWIDPLPTNHLFHATPLADSTSVIIEVHDRWGKTYQKSVSLK